MSKGDKLDKLAKEPEKTIFPVDSNVGLHKKQLKREDQKNLMHRREEGKPVPKPQSKKELKTLLLDVVGSRC